jgi:F-type H+-transporting ATPase subunit a
VSFPVPPASASHLFGPAPAHLLAKLEFPPIGELVDWKQFLLPGFNKPVAIVLVAVIGTLALFFVGGRKKQLVPTGAQNAAESVVDFITDGIIMQTMGPEGIVFLPFLTTMFCFILICNIFEVIPFIQFPATARMAFPLFMALIVWVMYMYQGFKHQGLRYVTNAIFPPGVPKALYLLVTPIEFVSTFIMRPFSLAVRLFANELAGHLLLVTFAVLTDTLLFHNSILFLKPVAILPAAMDVGITGFEVLVAVLQAFIFTILTAVYLASSLHAEH